MGSSSSSSFYFCFLVRYISMQAHLPLAGIGSLCGTPNSISAVSWYKLVISAMHFNVSPLVLGGKPWKCELCSCNLRLIRDITKTSADDVCMNWFSAEYCCNEKSKQRENFVQLVNMSLFEKSIFSTFILCWFVFNYVPKANQFACAQQYEITRVINYQNLICWKKIFCDPIEKALFIMNCVLFV